MKLNHLWWWLLPVLGLSALSCTREYIDNRAPVCFETEVLPIFQSNCTQSGCHNSQSREAGYDLSSYDKIVSRGIKPGDYKGSNIYQIIVAVAGVMPQAPYSRLSDAQVTTIALWIDEGAKNTTCVDTTSCDLSNVTFSGTVKPILETYCNGCHGGSSPQGNINYNTYNGVKATVSNGKLIGSIQHNSGFSAMPQNGNKLSDCNINKIKTWIDAGASNN